MCCFGKKKKKEREREILRARMFFPPYPLFFSNPAQWEKNIRKRWLGYIQTPILNGRPRLCARIDQGMVASIRPKLSVHWVMQVRKFKVRVLLVDIHTNE
jgi:hypothetical protein